MKPILEDSLAVLAIGAFMWSLFIWLAVAEASTSTRIALLP